MKKKKKKKLGIRQFMPNCLAFGRNLIGCIHVDCSINLFFSADMRIWQDPYETTHESGRAVSSVGLRVFRTRLKGGHATLPTSGEPRHNKIGLRYGAPSLIWRQPSRLSPSGYEVRLKSADFRQRPAPPMSILQAVVRTSGTSGNRLKGRACARGGSHPF